MSHEVPFHATRMGQKYYERTLPELVEQIRRLAEAVERLAEEDFQDSADRRNDGTDRG